MCECSQVARKLFIASSISLMTECHHRALRDSKMSPEEKAEHDAGLAMLKIAIHGLPDGPEEGTTEDN